MTDDQNWYPHVEDERPSDLSYGERVAQIMATLVCVAIAALMFAVVLKLVIWILL